MMSIRYRALMSSYVDDPSPSSLAFSFLWEMSSVVNVRTIIIIITLMEGGGHK